MMNSKEVLRRVRWTCVIAAGFALLAIAPWPIGFYTLSRIVIFFLVGFAALMLFGEGATVRSVLCALVAIVFNPCIRLYFDREVWQIIDAVSGVTLLAVAFLPVKFPAKVLQPEEALPQSDKNTNPEWVDVRIAELEAKLRRNDYPKNLE